MMVRP